jgi:hypothetical protein
VLALTDFGTYADAESTPIASVKITALETDGSLEYFNGTAWIPVTLNQVVVVADITAGNLRFVPNLNETGSPYATVGFQVSDGTDFSAVSNTLTINVMRSTILPSTATRPTASSRTRADGAVGDLLNNATDVEGDPLTITGYTIVGITGMQPVGTPVTIPAIYHFWCIHCTA